MVAAAQAAALARLVELHAAQAAMADKTAACARHERDLAACAARLEQVPARPPFACSASSSLTPYLYGLRHQDERQAAADQAAADAQEAALEGDIAAAKAACAQGPPTHARLATLQHEYERV